MIFTPIFVNQAGNENINFSHATPDVAGYYNIEQFNLRLLDSTLLEGTREIIVDKGWFRTGKLTTNVHV